MGQMIKLNTAYQDETPEAYIIQERINQLIECYGKAQVKVVFTSGRQGRADMSLGDKLFLEIHIENLIKTYGLGLVQGVMRLTYNVDKSLSFKQKRVKARRSTSNHDDGPKSA